MAQKSFTFQGVARWIVDGLREELPEHARAHVTIEYTAVNTGRITVTAGTMADVDKAVEWMSRQRFYGDRYFKPAWPAF